MPVLKVKNNGVWEEVAGASDHTHSEYAYASDISRLDAKFTNEFDNKVGDSSVAEQIEIAIAGLSAPTLAEHFASEQMVLTSLQYGDTLPDPGIAGRVFFKRVIE